MVERKVKENQLDEGGNIKYEAESMSNITLLIVAPSELLVVPPVLVVRKPPETVGPSCPIIHKHIVIVRVCNIGVLASYCR